MRVFKAPLLAAVAVATTLLATMIMLLVGGAQAAEQLHLTPNSQSVYQVFFHLKRSHSEAEIDKTFWDISTPGNDRFRKFLSKDQLKELVSAPRSVISKARSYLETEVGCSKITQLSTDDALVCTLDKKQEKSRKMAAALQQAFSSAEEETKQKGVFRMDVSDRLPLQVRKFLRSAVAYRAVNKNLLKKSKTTKQQEEAKNKDNKADAGAGFAGMTQTPFTINSRYSVAPASEFPRLSSSVIGAVGEFEGEYFTPSNMDTFAQRYNINRYNIEVMGANTPSQNADATEGTLDLQYMGSIFNATIPILWAEGSMSNSDPGEIDFSGWVDKLLSRTTVPAVVSISWGLGDHYYQNDMNVLIADNDAFRKAGLVGTSVFAASGDSGVGVRREIFQCSKFSPSWPSSSQYVTSVGATYANSMQSGEASVTWSGGGFSDALGRPAYQQEAVSNYLATNTKLPKSSYYNQSGRAYPDVSALGTNFMIYVGGKWAPVSGTSAACPTFAGVVTLIAAERVAAGKPLLGFLNPTIYQLGKVGYDVVEGQNQDTNCIPGVPIEGFAAQKGWDPVSGLGTPDYEYLRRNL